MKRKSAMQQAAAERAEMGQKLREVLDQIENTLTAFGAPYIPRIEEDPLFGPILRVLSVDTDDKIVIVLGDLDEFEITEDSDEALEITSQRKDDRYRFHKNGLVELKSRSALFAADIDFTTGGKK